MGVPELTAVVSSDETPHTPSKRRRRLKRPDTFLQWFDRDEEQQKRVDTNEQRQALQEGLFDAVILEDWLRVPDGSHPAEVNPTLEQPKAPEGVDSTPEPSRVAIDPATVLQYNLKLLRSTDPKLRREALEWVTLPRITGYGEPDEAHPAGRPIFAEDVPYSFRNCCRLLGINADRMLESLETLLGDFR